MVHDFTAAPFIKTVQAPQYVVSQPTWVPVRSSCSRSISTSSMRGSTSRAWSLPLTVTFNVTLAIASGIDMAHLDASSTGAADGDVNCPSDQRAHQRPFVVGRTAHVGLRISSGTGGFCGCGKRFLGNRLAAQGGFGITGFDGGKPDTAEGNGRFHANISIQRELHCGAGGRIYRSGTLECKIGSAAALRWHFDHDFADQFIVRQVGGVRIFDEILQVDRALAMLPQTPNLRGKST